jgi:methylenetetrahydrofolate/methylenetetrahydromethanopterin dehydrogenase (NADP+)
MRTLLLQLDSSPLPSVFDRVVGYDAGADEIMSYGGVTEAAVRDLVHGCIFTRGPKDLKSTAIFVGGADMGAGERILKAVQDAYFGPFRCSVLLDSNGSNTTAVAAVQKLVDAVGGDVKGKRAVVIAGTGPVGTRAAGLLSKLGARVTITSRRDDEGTRVAEQIGQRFGGTVAHVTVKDAAQVAGALDGAELLLNAGPAGVLMVPRAAWAGRAGLLAAADLNAVPPLGIEGIEVGDNGESREGAMVFGALGVGGLKMKVHKECVRRLFGRNDLVFDAESIADVAREVAAKT